MRARDYDSAPATLPLMVRAALPALPLVGKLPGIKHIGARVPDSVLTRREVTTDRSHLHRYNEVCGFAPGDTLPATYPHLAAFGLHMALMTNTSFPFAPMGLVHLRNTINQRRPIGACERFDVAVRAANLRPHPKGSLIDIVTTASIKGDVVWDEIMTLFARGKNGDKEPFAAPLDGIDPPDGVVHWTLKSDLGRRYGAVSGDRNPIHLYPLTAKAFGFPTNIAHGMWTKARCLAALHNRLPASFRVDVEFKKPILLPGTVIFGTAKTEDQRIFGVTGAKKPVPHLVGKIVTSQ